MSHRSVGTLIALLVLAGSSPPDAEACARVSPARASPVVLEGEEALIVWEPETQTQHFVRSGLFSGADADFGFLVPTPSRPELAEAPSGIFERLFQIYRAPPLPPRPPREPRYPPGLHVTVRGTEPPPPVVRVLEHRQVAGLDATVLEANDVGALDAWLAEHAYPVGPDLRQWLRPYVERGWILTAFRYDPGSEVNRFRSRAVRMSFHTERPFFPYSEPTGGDHRPRPFRVSLVAPTRMRVTAGRFRGRVGYARPLETGDMRTILRGVLPVHNFGTTGAYLTVFDEPRSVRGRQDIFFGPSRGRPVAPRLRDRILNRP